MTSVIIPGYRISEQLYKGSRTVVYRGYRESDLLPVVIKLLKNPYPSFTELLSFRNQYTIAKNIRSPLFIQTYSLESYQNSYALVMEDFGGISLKQWVVRSTRQSLQEFLQIAIALCNALDVLYRDRIIHKDIKPANILINPETKQVKLIDFSIASLLPRETQTLINPNVLEGTLAYISPEQTGRMNRGIDYRTDFYSVGVTFYELLTGELPFTSNDPMELVHCHIAKQPPPLGNRKEIPQVICDIVMKLMAKNARDRYQSALGLKFDLENCLHQLQESRRIESFEIARRDVCDIFIIPDQLYGRETEVENLLQAFERVSLGATEMMLVAGFSGIGKTAIVNEVHKPIVRERGYFIKGKYDQFQRNIPLSAFVQAFRELMGQLLTENDIQIQQWRNKILEAISENGQVIIEVIPELEKIIGEQPSVIELSGIAAQNRFNLLFQRFTQVFTNAEHPLVMFLDDLQWADSASLKLIQILMADTRHLLLIGAYRDNEVNPAHPLMLTLSEIKKNQATINTITLAPLSQVQVNQLVADTLKCTESLAWILSELVYQKTQGNPFFATQFLKALHQDNLIQFDFELACWQCKIPQVTTQSVTDDVVAFMAFQLRKLPQLTQNTLQLAACIGNQFDLATLAIVSEKSEIETAADLWKALQEGLILPLSDVYKFYVGQNSQAVTQENSQTVTYKFLHDRIQQAAYALIPDEQKQVTHLQIGRLLQSATTTSQKDEKIFAIVNHLNKGVSLITNELEQRELLQLNLVAGRKAKSATAYGAAWEYFNTGISLLTSNYWQSQYNLALVLHEEAAESAYLSTNFEQMEQLAEVVLNNAHFSLDRTNIYVIKIQACMAQNQQIKALQLAQEILGQLGVYLPERPSQSDIEQALGHTQTLLNGRSTEFLLELPEMTALEKKAAMVILSSIISSAYQAAPDLLPLVIFAEFDLSIQYGNTAESTHGYVMYGLTLMALLGDIDTGYRFGQLGIDLLLLHRLQTDKLIAKTIFAFNCFLKHWREPARDTLKGYLQAYSSGLETGEIEYAALSLMCYSYTAYWIGQELSSLKQTMASHHQVIQQLRQDTCLQVQSLYDQSVYNLLELVVEPDRLCGEYCNEDEVIQLYLKTNEGAGLCQVYLHKLFLSYLFQHHEQALENSQLAEEYLGSVTGLMLVPVFYFYDALIRLAIYLNADVTNQKVILERVATHQEKLSMWAVHAPSNQSHRCALVAAERCRILGAKIEASEHYDQAIALAKANGYIQEEALANELAAKFYLDWGRERIAQDYLIAAYYAYARWGTKAKVADLEKRYPQLLAPILHQTRSPMSTNETVFALGSFTTTSSHTSTSSSVSVALDLATILKAFQTISGEIELEKLLSVLLHIVIENAGADKCVFMLLESDRLLIQGIAKLSFGVTSLQNREITHVDFYSMLLNPQYIEDCVDMPVGLINTVKRTLKSAVIVDATIHPQLINDAYIQQQQPKSILCSPILHQGKLLGLLYLENNLTTGVFTHERVELLNLLCTQAAISLENAQLYQRSQNYAQQIERSLDELKATQSRFYNLVNNVPGVVYQFHIAADGTITMPYISADCYNLYEITAEQAISNVQLLLDRIHSEDAARYQQSIVESMQTLNPWRWEGRIVTLSGIIKWIHGESHIVPGADGSLVWDGVLLDISDRKKAELALQQKSLDLQQAQLQIVQSEKMSALGNLVAGVAHEMNNPLGFISASLKQVKPTIADLVEHLGLYQRSLPNKSDEILTHAKEIELDYSLEDLPKMIDSMGIACDRLKNISTSLRTFSRADQDYKVPFNIHQGIDSTILILKHRLKANEQRPAIEVVTNYGNLPQVVCFPGQLNQVFMNILANAIDALNESNTGRSFEEIKANPNCITITTSGETNLVKIIVADNGIGMSESVKQKIFEYLFTTKAVGKGTGLGLAITKQILVEKHKGSLFVNSTLGKGTEFVITLPILG